MIAWRMEPAPAGRHSKSRGRPRWAARPAEHVYHEPHPAHQTKITYATNLEFRPAKFKFQARSFNLARLARRISAGVAVLCRGLPGL